MKLIIEQAHDHMECLDQVREIHGNDCMIVNSFKQPDRYCIIVAVENTSVNTGAELVSAVVGKTVSHAIPVASKGGHTDAAVLSASDTKSVDSTPREHRSREITPSILGLARKLGALSEETKDPREHSVDVSDKEFEALSFSEVMSEVVSQSSSNENKTQSEYVRALAHNTEEPIQNDAFVEVGETQTSHKKIPLSDSAMLFSSIMHQCIKMDVRENLVGT